MVSRLRGGNISSAPGRGILDKYITNKDPLGEYPLMNRYLESWKKDYSKE